MFDALNKFIVSDFPKKTTIEQELLNIFYNRENEIKFLEKLRSEELKVINSEEKHLKWSKKEKRNLINIDIVKAGKGAKKENLPFNIFEKAKYNFNKLMENIRTYD